jgi:hypothetical protein
MFCIPRYMGRSYLPIPLLAAICFTGACSKNKAPEPVAVDQVPATVESAFKDAPAEVKSSADEIAAAVQGKDNAKALIDLQTLFARPDLTPEQREAASQSMRSLHQQLRSAAAQGDARAAEALQTYGARK